MTSTTGQPTLPVWPTVREAFASVPANWQAALRIFGPWLAILIGIGVLEFRMFPAPGKAHPAAFFLLTLLSTALWFIAFASTAVAWHRLMLLGEQPPLFNLRVRAPVMRYLGRFVLIGLTTIPVQLACSLFFFYFLPPGSVLPPLSPSAPPSAGRLLAYFLYWLIVSLPAILVVSRISISLPAIAVARPMGLEDAWQLTAGNALQLCGGTLSAYMPAFVVGSAIQLSVQPRPGETLPVYLTMLAHLGLMVFSTIAAVSFLSLSYRFFAGPQQTPEPQSRPQA